MYIRIHIQRISIVRTAHGCAVRGGSCGVWTREKDWQQLDRPDPVLAGPMRRFSRRRRLEVPKQRRTHSKSARGGRRGRGGEGRAMSCHFLGMVVWSWDWMRCHSCITSPLLVCFRRERPLPPVPELPGAGGTPEKAKKLTTRLPVLPSPKNFPLVAPNGGRPPRWHDITRPSSFTWPGGGCPHCRSVVSWPGGKRPGRSAMTWQL